MSHELRTPLNAVIGYAEMLRDEAMSGRTDPAQIATDLDRIAMSGQHLLVLISDILDFSKIEAGGMDLADEVIDLDSLVNEAVSTVAPQCKTHGNTLTITPAASCCQVRGDYLRIKQVLINLLGNAAKFTENGSIDIKYGITGCDDGQPGMYFEITDTGIGISEASMPFLYEKFRQVDSTHTRRHGGTGLGLAISKRLVDLMNGIIEVTSSVGHGTTFKLMLPSRSAGPDESALSAGEDDLS
jgi:signal transduction histidine kinase